MGAAEDEEAEEEGPGSPWGQAAAHWPRVSHRLGVARSRLLMAQELCAPCRHASACGVPRAAPDLVPGADDGGVPRGSGPEVFSKMQGLAALWMWLGLLRCSREASG